MQETRLEVKHDYCIHCGVCVMMQFADNKDGKKVIKLDLPKEQFSLAENCCPVVVEMNQKKINKIVF